MVAHGEAAMDETKVGLGVVLVAASGLALKAANHPASQILLILAGLATVGLVTYAILDGRDRHFPQ